MSLRWAVLAPALLWACALAAGCRSGAVETVAVAPPPPPKRMVQPITLEGRVACAGACRVDLFDGSTLTEGTLSADGRITLPRFFGAGDLLLFISGPGQIPQVRPVTEGQPFGEVRLQRDPDPRRGGYLAAAAVTVTTGGKLGGGRRMEPVAGAELTAVVGRAREAAVTDESGAVVMALPANRYAVLIGGSRHEVTVPQGGTVLLPVVLGKRMVD